MVCLCISCHWSMRSDCSRWVAAITSEAPCIRKSCFIGDAKSVPNRWVVTFISEVLPNPSTVPSLIDAVTNSKCGFNIYFFNKWGEVSSSRANFLLFEPWTTVVSSVSVISNRTNLSFWLILLILVCECIKFLSSKDIFMVSEKVTLDMVHILLGLETVSFSTYRCTYITSQCIIIQKASFSVY
jgi:hypothetical protein